MSKKPSQDYPPDSPGAKLAGELQKVVVDEVLEREARQVAARQSKVSGIERRGLLVRVTVAVFAAFFVYLLLFQPRWIAPSAASPIPTAAIDDGLRASIFITVRHIEAFRDAQGRLPTDLAEAGGGRAEVVYRRVDTDTYQLTATTGETELTYTSSDPLEVFVRGSLRVLGGGS